MTDLIRARVMLPPGSPVERGPQWTDLWIREGTSDEDVLREVWLEDVYRVRGLALVGPRVKYTETNSLGQIVTQVYEDGPPPVVVDLGACTGIFSALICAMYPDVRVIAVEPDAANVELLKRNVDLSRVDVWPCAVGGRGGVTGLVGEAGTAHTEPSFDGPEVRMVELATILQSVERVAFLKVDVEGSEFEIFRALEPGDLARVDRIAMEWHGTVSHPWLFFAPIGDVIEQLLHTHAVEVFGDPAHGGYVFAHRYAQ